MRIGQALIGLVGLLDAAAEAAMPLVPGWSYEMIGAYPPGFEAVRIWAGRTRPRWFT
jgi:hypothetical protein